MDRFYQAQTKPLSGSTNPTRLVSNPPSFWYMPSLSSFPVWVEEYRPERLLFHRAHTRARNTHTPQENVERVDLSSICYVLYLQQTSSTDGIFYCMFTWGTDIGFLSGSSHCYLHPLVSVDLMDEAKFCASQRRNYGLLEISSSTDGRPHVWD